MSKPANVVPLVVVPITRDKAWAWVREHHSHLPTPPCSWMFGTSIEIADTGERVCVASIGRPSARMLDDGKTAEITRVATKTVRIEGGVEYGVPNAASMAIGALTRAARALGFVKVISYILEIEAGTCLRAAGFRLVAESYGGEWARAERKRKPAQEAGAKTRWERSFG